ncbi:MAG: YceI family protein [Verrucomicrobiae bacterium]|nr:YceI family protein [Verrucomicrobiae bacterium]
MHPSFFRLPSFARFHAKVRLAAMGCLLAWLPLAPAEESWSGTCTIEFLGKSTLHDFTGTVPAREFTLKATNLEDHEKAQINAEISVAVKNMDTKDEKRDENMRDSLKEKDHPLISVTLDDLKVADTKPKWEGRLPIPSKLPFELTIMGTSHEETGKVESWSEKNGVVTMVVTFPVSLKAYDISVPTVLGFIKVKDTIEVKAILTLKPAA